MLVGDLPDFSMVLVVFLPRVRELVPDLRRSFSCWFRGLDSLVSFFSAGDGDSWLTWWFNHLPGKPIFLP